MSKFKDIIQKIDEQNEVSNNVIDESKITKSMDDIISDYRDLVMEQLNQKSMNKLEIYRAIKEKTSRPISAYRYKIKNSNSLNLTVNVSGDTRNGKAILTISAFLHNYDFNRIIDQISEVVPNSKIANIVNFVKEIGIMIRRNNR